MSKLREAAQAALQMLERALCSTGYCCCGSEMESHGIYDGHGPVDEGDYHQEKAIAKLKAALDEPPPKPRREFLALAEQCGATLTGKPDGSEDITVVFSIEAWRKFDALLVDPVMDKWPTKPLAQVQVTVGGVSMMAEPERAYFSSWAMQANEAAIRKAIREGTE